MRWRPLGSLRAYQAGWIAPDLLAALTLLVIAIPEQLATSRLAGMPPVTGYYAFAAGAICFALLGSSRQLSVGADSTIAPLFAIGVAHLAPTGSPGYVALVGLLAVEVGLVVGIIGVLRLGWIAEFLSAPIISGFLGGVAVIIAVHELPELLGLRTAGDTVERLRVIASNLPHANTLSLAVGAGVVILMVAAQRVDRRIPAALVGVVGSTVAAAVFDLPSRGVAVLGAFSHGAPHFGLQNVSAAAAGQLAPLAGVVALVVLAQTAATTRAFAAQGGYDVDVSSDFLGVGAGSVVAGLVGAFPVDASPPRTAAAQAAGGRSQVAGLAAAAALLLLVPFAGLLRDLPVATLAGVLLVVAGRIFPVRELRAIFRFDLLESALAAITLLTVALIGVEQGIGVAVGLAILDRTRLSASPQLHVLGRLPGTTSWAPLSSGAGARQVPGVLVVLFATPLWYANAEHFRAEMEVALGRAEGGPPRAVVLDTIGMSDLDFTGAAALREVLDRLQGLGATFGIARAGDRIRGSLRRSGLEQRIGADRFFPSVDEAVLALQPS